MISVHSFVFNPFQENTYLLTDETGKGVVIDPGMENSAEENEFTSYIDRKSIELVGLWNTHCHIDHVLGNAYVCKKYGLVPQCHEEETKVLGNAEISAEMFGIRYIEAPAPITVIKEGRDMEFGKSRFKVLFTPGHSPGSVCFYEPIQGFVIGGDVLFREGIGRTDLPGGDFKTLLGSIVRKLFLLPDTTIVYSGHGPATTIGYEKTNNPFLS